MIKVQIFKAYTVEELEESVNSFLKSFNTIKVSDATLSESDHDYKMVVIYEDDTMEESMPT